ncbi:MAG: DUF5916 domain-containing protein, partial [Gemmatimonas sp.]
MRRFASGLVTLLAAALPVRAAAQVVDSATKTVTAVPAPSDHAAPTSRSPSSHVAPAAALALRSAGQVKVDGRLNELVWHSAVPITSFTQTEPEEGAPGSEATIVRFAFDDEAIYIGAVMNDRGPVSLRVARRDANFTDSDVFAVSLDSYHDHQTAFRFAVNASGVKRDEIITSTGGGGGGGGGGGDASWDPVWEAATVVTKAGWTVELRIPFSQLRFGRGEAQTWGLQMERRIARKQEHSVYAFTSKLQRGGPPRFGHLSGMNIAGAGHRLEILPYAYGRASYRTTPVNSAAGFANPYRSPADYARGVGADLKYRLTSNFTLDATFNPDFGQVEVDPAQINLSAFETRFDERRPFFVEGAEIFRFGSSLSRESQLLYSRRIGRAPQGAIPSAAVYSNVPEAATILGAAKLTGKTASGWSAGILEAITTQENARYVDVAHQSFGAVVEPVTSYFTGRVRRSSSSGGTSAGALFTAVNRQLRDEALALRLRSDAYVGGMDFRHEWGNRDYSIGAQFSSSVVQGRRQPIASAQRSSARYFQRPDAKHLALDTFATSLSGYNSFVAIGKFAGAWQRNLSGSATTPGYEINDLGFQPNADRLTLDANASYRRATPGRHLRRWEINVGSD